VDSLTGSTGEVVKVLADRKTDVVCVQEIRCMDSGCMLLVLLANGISCSGVDVERKLKV